ncbi:MAG: PAS domain-containing protein [Undibacterium sp.]|nr:PAS domain-containing protein [Opitutaceae bacterium]
MHPEDRERTLEARANLAEGVPVRGLENRYRCKDGSYRWLAWQTAIEPGATTVFAVARDVTERRRLDEENLILSKLESTGILAGGIAHHFNNLLFGLMLSLEMIKLDGPLNAEQETYRHEAMTSAHAAHTLTERLIAFANVGGSVRKPTELTPLLRQSLELALRGSHVRGECDVAVDLWPAEIDADQIARLIRNLALNACEAIPRGGRVQLRAENVVLTAPNQLEIPAGHYVCISMADAGAGIAPDLLPKIFDPYFSTKRRGSQKGMGPGLTICYTVIERHGGALTVNSLPGQGTTVQCQFPASLPDTPPLTPASAPGPAPLS